MDKEFKLPDLGEGLVEAIIREWHIQQGDHVEVDQPLVSVETDKALVEIPSPFTGRIKKLCAKVDDTIHINVPLIIFDVAQDSSIEEDNDSQTVVGKIDNKEVITDLPSIDNNQSIMNKLTVEAWQLLNDLDLSEADLINSFANAKIISVKDLETAFPNKINAIQSPSNLSSIRSAMNQKISAAATQVAQVTIYDDANLNDLDNDIDITVHIIKSLSMALQKEPVINSHFNSQSKQLTTLRKINCGIAMDSEHGLFVPVLKDVADKDAKQIREEINQFKDKVKNKKLPKEDTLDASIIISNFGMFGAKYATPMVMPPMVAIVGIGKMHEKAVVNKHGEITKAKILPISISVDHRVITGGEATRFLATLISALEQNN